MLLHNIGVQHALLLQIMRNRILRQKWRLQPDLGSNPFALGVRRIRGVIAAAATAKLRAKVGALNLVKLPNLVPCLIADSSRNIDFQSDDRHPEPIHQETQCCVSSAIGVNEGVLLWNQAAGLVVRRFAINSASPNMTSENKTRVAIADGNGNDVSTPGYNSALSASTP